MNERLLTDYGFDRVGITQFKFIQRVGALDRAPIFLLILADVKSGVIEVSFRTKNDIQPKFKKKAGVYVIPFEQEANRILRQLSTAIGEWQVTSKLNTYCENYVLS